VAWVRAPVAHKRKRLAATEIDMNASYGLDIIDDCDECTSRDDSFFCNFSDLSQQALNEVNHKSVLPAGAILFVEGQTPRGIFILGSGKVNLSTTSREGKILILKTAEDGEALGLSATISGVGYEATAETSTSCQLSFVDRKHFLELMQSHSEVGMHTAQCLSRDFHSAYRDIHHLVLTRSSAGKLARLLLSHSPNKAQDEETRIHATITHEEMAQRIGAARNRNPTLEQPKEKEVDPAGWADPGHSRPQWPEGSGSLVSPRRRTANCFALLRSCAEHCSAVIFGRRDGMYKVMYSSTLIDDLFAAVERVQNSAAARQIKPTEAYTATSRTPTCQSPNNSRSRFV
jgi:CRP/FNR family transcriptional regulator, cyclic AMP receptor protein